MNAKHITTALTNEEIELIIDFVEAKDNLTELIDSGVKGFILSPEWDAMQNVQKKVWQYVKYTGRAINVKVGLFAFNSWE